MTTPQHSSLDFSSDDPYHQSVHQHNYVSFWHFMQQPQPQEIEQQADYNQQATDNTVYVDEDITSSHVSTNKDDEIAWDTIDWNTPDIIEQTVGHKDTNVQPVDTTVINHEIPMWPVQSHIERSKHSSVSSQTSNASWMAKPMLSMVENEEFTGNSTDINVEPIVDTAAIHEHIPVSPSPEQSHIQYSSVELIGNTTAINDETPILAPVEQSQRSKHDSYSSQISDVSSVAKPVLSTVKNDETSGNRTDIDVKPIESTTANEEIPMSPPPKQSHVRHFRHDSFSSQTSNASSVAKPVLSTVKNDETIGNRTDIDVKPIENATANEEIPMSPPPKQSHIRHFRHDSFSSQTSNASSIAGPMLSSVKQDPINLSISTSPKKRRQESLHKRFQEASAKSKLALERLQREKGLLNTSPAPPLQPTVSLWSTDAVSSTKAVLLMPVQWPNTQRPATNIQNVSPLAPPSKPTSTSTPKENAPSSSSNRKEATAAVGPPPSANKGKTSSTISKQPEAVKEGKRGILTKNQPVDSTTAGILKKEDADGKNAKGNLRRRASANGDETEEAEKENAQLERDRHRPSSRGSIHSAYDGYAHDDRRHRAPEEYGHRRHHDWYRSYYGKPRPYSRASDREDWRYFHRDDRSRPRSTQSYAGERDVDDEDEERENDGEDENSDNGSDRYDDDDERRELEAYHGRRGGYSRYAYQNYGDHYRYQHAYHHYNQQQYHLGSFDPAWQRYIMEYYRYYGQYPTHDQLQRMWSEQQKRGQQQKQQPSGKNQIDTQQQSNEQEQKPTAIAQSKDVLTLQCASGEDSQVSLSRQASERSFDVRSDLDSNISGLVFTARTAATAPEKIREPLKHSVCHAICRFGAGGHLIMVTCIGGGANNARSGNWSKCVEIRNTRTFIADERCRNEMENIEKFPGPLSPKDTSKLAVVQFCQKKLDEISKYTASDGITDRESVALIWRFLLLLVRQNGIAMGNDLAQLLLEMRSETSSAVSDEYTGLGWSREVEREPFHSSARNGRGTDEDAGVDGSTDDQLDDGIHERDHRHRMNRDSRYRDDGRRASFDRTLMNCSTQTSDCVEFQFRQLLLSGNKKEALEWAVKYRLWGHALFLAMKVDQRTHTNVMTRFANSLALNDPLQTLYQMLSGGVPYAVTRIPDERWGDWRPHLAMILSNLTPTSVYGQDAANVDTQLHQQRQQEQQQQEFWSIFNMGKTLMSAGRPYAAHFCFLCCHVLAGWDVFNPSQVDGQQKRLVSLIGAYDEEKHDDVFAIERYQCTEVYEYAVGLRNQPVHTASALPAVQIYKWTYVLRLAEYGYREEAYRYLHELNFTIQAYPAYFVGAFVKSVCELAGRLQQFDPTVETIGSSFRTWQQPNWIGELAALATGLQAPVNYQLAQSEPAINQGQTYIQQQAQSLSQPIADYVQQPAVVQHPVQQELIQRDYHASALVHAPAIVTDSRQSSVPREFDRQSSMGGPSYDYDLSASQTSNFLIDAYNRQEYEHQAYGGSPVRDHRSPSISSQQESVASMSTNEPYGRRGSRSYAEVATPPRAQTSGQMSPTATPKYAPFQQPTDYWESMAGAGNNQMLTRDRQYSGSSAVNQQEMMTMIVTATPSPQSADFGTPPSAGSDNVFGNSPLTQPQPMYHQQQPIVKMKAEMSAQVIQHAALAPTRRLSTGEVKSAPPGSSRILGEDKTKRNPSWLGNMVGKALSKVIKGPNEMILPDDRNKKIVWDADKQRWVNVDGDDDENNQIAAPPPMDSQLHAPPDPPAANMITQANALSTGRNFLQEAYQQADQQLQQSLSAQKSVQQDQQFGAMGQQQSLNQSSQQVVQKPISALNRYRKSENRRYVDVFGAGGGSGGVASNVPFAPPWPPAEVGNVNVFTPDAS